MRQHLEQSSFGTLLLIGAGELNDLSTAVAAAEQVILVEPDSGRLKSLELVDDKVTVLEAFAGLEVGKAELSVFNLPGLSSLKTPTGLKDLYPGLRVVRKATVSVAPLGDLMALLDARPAPYGLMLNTTGVEADLLQGLIANGAITRFSRIDLRTGKEPLFEGALPIDQVKGFLSEAGFVLSAQDDEDPDWPTATFDLDVQALKLKTLTEELRVVNEAAQKRETALTVSLAAAEAEHAKTISRAEQAEAKIKDLVSALADIKKQEADGKAKFAELEATHQALLKKADWRNGRIGELEAALKEREAQITEAKAIKQAGEMRIQQAEARANELQANLTAEASCKADLQSKLDQLSTAHQELSTKADWRERRIKELGSEKAALDAAAQSREADLVQKISNTDAKAKELEGKLNAAQKQEADGKAKFAELEATHQALLKKADWWNGRIGELEAALKEREAQITEAKAIKQAGEMRIQQAEARANELQANLTAEASCKADLQSKLDQLSTAHQELSTKADWRERRIKELGSEKAALDAAAQSREADLVQKISNTDAKAKELEGKLNAAQKQEADGKAKFAELEATHQALLKKADWWNGRIGELEAALKEREAQITEAKAIKQAGEMRIQQAEARANELQANLTAEASCKADLQSKLDQLSTAHQELSTKADWRERRIKELGSEKAALDAAAQSREADLVQKISNTDAKAKELEGKLNAAQKQEADGKAKFAELEATHQALLKKADWWNGRIGELEAALKEREAQITVQLTKIEKLETTNVAATEHSQSLKTALDKQISDAKASEKSAIERRDAVEDSLAMSLRTQAMLQGDLRDLQEKYQEVLAVKTKQQALLDALKPRLQQAAQYLQLQQSEAEDAHIIAEVGTSEKSVRARKKKSAKSAKRKTK